MYYDTCNSTIKIVEFLSTRNLCFLLITVKPCTLTLSTFGVRATAVCLCLLQCQTPFNSPNRGEAVWKFKSDNFVGHWCGLVELR